MCIEVIYSSTFRYVPFNGEGTLQATFQGLTAGEFYTIYLQAMAQNVASDASQASYYTSMSL